MKHCLVNIISLIMLFFFSLSPLSVHSQYKWAVTGRAVDEFGNPVRHARVLVFPSAPEGWAGGTITDEKADAEGRFRFERNSSVLVNNESFLYVTSPFPKDADIPINLIPPFRVSRQDHPALNGLLLRFKSNQELNVGDVPVQVYYGVVIVYLQDRRGKPMFTDAKEWEYIGIRIRDVHGKIVQESDLSPASARDAVREKGSAVAIMLPEGVWRIEIAPAGLKQKWPFGLKGKLFGSDMLTVKRDENLETIVKPKK